MGRQGHRGHRAGTRQALLQASPTPSPAWSTARPALLRVFRASVARLHSQRRHAHFPGPVAALLSLVLACLTASARADVLISSFDSPDCLQGRYGGWEDIEPCLRNEHWSIAARQFGGAFRTFAQPGIDAAAETQIELVVCIEPAGDPGDATLAGPLVVLEDAEGNQWIWAWYGLGAGHHVLNSSLKTPTFTRKPGSPSGLDFSRLAAFHIQVDPGQSQAAYRITFRSLRLLGARTGGEKSPPP